MGKNVFMVIQVTFLGYKTRKCGKSVETASLIVNLMQFRLTWKGSLYKAWPRLGWPLSLSTTDYFVCENCHLCRGTC